MPPWSTGAYLRTPPRGAEVGALVDEVRQFWREHGSAGCDSHIAALGWRVERQKLAAHAGGLQALLIPLLYGGFRFVIDPDPAPAQAAAGVPESVIFSWRLAHEYAHTFFYGRRAVPRRPSTPTRGEELFCDAFANVLLGTELSSLDETPIT
jgi:hypothetical protein